MLGVVPDVAVVAGVLVELSCSLTFKGDFSLLSSSFSAAEETASVTSIASNPSSICSSRVKFKVLLSCFFLSSESGFIIDFRLGFKKDTLVDPVLDVSAEVAVLAGDFDVDSVGLDPAIEDADLEGSSILTLVVLCLAFKGDFRHLFSSISAAEDWGNCISDIQCLVIPPLVQVLFLV